MFKDNWRILSTAALIIVFSSIISGQTADKNNLAVNDVILLKGPETDNQGNQIRMIQGTGYVEVTVVILKAKPDSKMVRPALTFINDAAGCSIHDEDGWTGETPAEYYFTVRIPDRNEKAPTVLVDMKGIAVRRVLMPGKSDPAFESVEAGIKITLVKNTGNIRHIWSNWTDQAGTDIQFPWNWTERRDGRYADPEPLYINRNLAQIVYAIGAREVYSEWDISNYLEKNFPGNGDAAAIGYENNFPRRHEDYPPHIHIWFKWPDWRGYNTHLYMDDKGEIHDCWIITPSGSNFHPGAGEWQEKKDDEERIVFYVRFTESGAIEMQKTKNDPVYTLKIDPRDVNKLTVLKDKIPVKSIHIGFFDPTISRLEIETCDLRTKRMKVEVLVADRDTGGGKRIITETDLPPAN